jgi:putative lipoprotein
MSAPAETQTVRGELVLPAGDVPDAASRVVVRVEDVSRADAPSVVVGEQQLQDVPLEPEGRIPFAVEVPHSRIDPRAQYSVAAHVDVVGTGTIKPGDFISMASYPVLTRGHGDSATVEVRRV